jgi:hypothetical protein
MKLSKKIMDLGAAMFMIMVAVAGYMKECYASMGGGRDWWVFPK